MHYCFSFRFLATLGMTGREKFYSLGMTAVLTKISKLKTKLPKKTMDFLG